MFEKERLDDRQATHIKGRGALTPSLLRQGSRQGVQRAVKASEYCSSFPLVFAVRAKFNLKRRT